MTKTLEATYDGEVLRPDEPLELDANTRVKITIETQENRPGNGMSFLDTARSLNLEGPPIGLPVLGKNSINSAPSCWFLSILDFPHPLVTGRFGIIRT
ncbi:MAG TPA: antitoxin family protein, partial [Pyrinomonadaceae bacterium]|nr:antitoxin family protein [Pyrinomonadaceae bacterium]